MIIIHPGSFVYIYIYIYNTCILLWYTYIIIQIAIIYNIYICDSVRLSRLLLPNCTFVYFKIVQLGCLFIMLLKLNYTIH